MNARLPLAVAAATLLAFPRAAAKADQSADLVGAHEIPRFVLDRVELPTGVCHPQKPDDAQLSSPTPSGSKTYFPGEFVAGRWDDTPRLTRF
jgi:hypothetical protein